MIIPRYAERNSLRILIMNRVSRSRVSLRTAGFATMIVANHGFRSKFWLRAARLLATSR